MILDKLEDCVAWWASWQEAECQVERKIARTKALRNGMYREKKRKILTKPVESLRFRFVRAGADVDAVDAAAVDEHPFCL